MFEYLGASGENKMEEKNKKIKQAIRILKVQILNFKLVLQKHGR
jgi:hypothetical protein